MLILLCSYHKTYNTFCLVLVGYFKLNNISNFLAGYFNLNNISNVLAGYSYGNPIVDNIARYQLQFATSYCDNILPTVPTLN